MHLTPDETNTLALLLEQKKGGLNHREAALFKRVGRYFQRSLRVRALRIYDDVLQREYEKDFEEEKDGRYR